MILRKGKENFLWLVAFSAPLASTLLAMGGLAFYLTFISLYFSQQGYGQVPIGFLQGAYFFGLFTGAFFLEKILRRIGHVQMLALSGSLLTATILSQALTMNLYLWVATRFLAGIALASFYIVVECWMLDRSEFHQRGLVLSLYMFVLNAGYALGQQFIQVISFDRSDAFVIASLLTATSIIPVVLSTKKLTLPSAESGIKLVKLVKISPFGTSCCLASGLLLGALYSFLPVAVKENHILGAQLVAILVVGGLIAQWPLGKLSDLIDRRKLLLVLCLFLFGINLLLLFLGISASIYCLALILVLGGVVFTMYPISLTQVADHLKHDQLAAGTSALLLLYGGGSAVGPILSAYVMQYVGTEGLFIFLAAIGLILSLQGLNTVRVKKPIPEEEKEVFVALPRTTSVAYEMDPRIEEEEEYPSYES